MTVNEIAVPCVKMLYKLMQVCMTIIHIPIKFVQNIIYKSLLQLLNSFLMSHHKFHNLYFFINKPETLCYTRIDMLS